MAATEQPLALLDLAFALSVNTRMQVFDTPSDHVTRDYREGLAQLGDLRFRVIDTSGLEPAAAAHTLQGRAAALTRGVLHSSHGVVMLLDAR